MSPTSTPASASKFFSRPVIASLILIPLLWWAVDRTGFRTYLEIESGARGIRLTVNGQKVELAKPLGPLTSVGIVATHSFFPTGCESLVLTPAGSPPQVLNAPRRFVFATPYFPLTGDWWEDRFARQTPQFQQKVNVTGEFKLTGVFTGRALEGFEIVLEGAERIRIFSRSGSLNNDLGLISGRGEVIARGLKENPGVDLPHFLQPLAAGLLAAAVLVVLFAAVGRLARREQTETRWSIRWAPLTAVVLVFGIVTSLWVADSVLSGRPHFQDDLGYLLRAKWLLAGRLSLEIPPLSEHFTIPWTFFIQGKWMSQYTLGWPALLALGEAVHAAWIIGPLCSLVLGYATWRLGRECGGPVVGFAAAVLGTVSPLGQLLAGSMMSHTAAAMWIALFLWLYVQGWRAEKRPGLILGLAGLALGAAFATRPLAALSVAFPAGLYGAAEMIRLRWRRPAWQGLAGVIIGGALASLPQLIDNKLVTGNPLLFAYTLCKHEGWALTTYPEGLFWADRTFAQVPGAAFGWGWPWAGGSPVVLALALGFAAVPLLAGAMRQTDWLMVGVIVTLPVAYMGYNGGTSLHGFGPRYYADIFVALFVLTARGFQVLGNLTGPRRSTQIAAALLFAILTGSTAISLPKRLELARNYNGINDGAENALKKNGITRGLILLSEPAYLMWIRVGRLLPIDLKSNLVFAQQRGDNRALLKAYEGWPVFILDGADVKPYPTSALPAHAP